MTILVTIFNYSRIFAVTVFRLHTIRTASGSFLKDSFLTTDNTPPLPLLEAHLGGLFFYRYE